MWTGCFQALAWCALVLAVPGTCSTNPSVNTTLPPLCNGSAGLCGRKYSNITYVATHNSPFNKPLNPGSNQAEDVETQLNDGVRMCQFLQSFLRHGRKADGHSGISDAS